MNAITCISRNKDNQVNTIIQCRPDLSYDTIMMEIANLAKQSNVSNAAFLTLSVARAMDGIGMPWETTYGN